MGYIEKVLQPGETVRYRGRLSMIVYTRSLIILMVGLVILITGAVLSITALLIVGATIALLGILLALAKMVERAGTEITVTDQRVVIKVGLVRRRTIEMNLAKIESVDVSQGIVGRLFDFGDIIVRGTGAGIEPLHLISRPLEFRRSVLA